MYLMLEIKRTLYHRNTDICSSLELATDIYYLLKKLIKFKENPNVHLVCLKLGAQKRFDFVVFFTG